MNTSNKKYTFGFDRIVIIESLPEEDTKTGLILNNKINETQSDLKSDYFFVESKQEFLNGIHSLLLETKQGNIPYIHIEMHGSEEKDGLVLNKGDFIDWYTLAELLRGINLKSGNNLFLSLAACYGNHFYKTILPNKPSPCSGFIGAWHELEPIDITMGFKAFFEILINKDLNSALEALSERSKNKCTIYMTDEIFDRVFEGYIEKELTLERINQRKINIIKMYLMKLNKFPGRKVLKDFEKEIRNITKMKYHYKRIFKHIESEKLFHYQNLLYISEDDLFKNIIDEATQTYT